MVKLGNYVGLKGNILAKISKTIDQKLHLRRFPLIVHVAFKYDYNRLCYILS